MGIDQIELFKQDIKKICLSYDGDGKQTYRYLMGFIEGIKYMGYLTGKEYNTLAEYIEECIKKHRGVMAL